MEIKIENKSCIKRKCDKKEMEKLVEVMILPSIGKGTGGGLQLNLPTGCLYKLSPINLV